MGKFRGVLWTSTALAAGMAVTVSGCADGSGTILTGHDPYSDSAPPNSAASALLGTRWSGITGS